MRADVNSVLNGSNNTDFVTPYTLKMWGSKNKGIVESKNNENGSYIKFNDGTMICINTIEFYNINFNKSFGVLYLNDEICNLGKFAHSFIDIPIINVTPTAKNPSFNYDVLVGMVVNTTETNAGTVDIMRPKQTFEAKFYLDYIAFGHWK